MHRRFTFIMAMVAMLAFSAQGSDDGVESPRKIVALAQDDINRLPRDVKAIIFEYASEKEFPGHLRLVCKNWRDVLDRKIRVGGSSLVIDRMSVVTPKILDECRILLRMAAEGRGIAKYFMYALTIGMTALALPGEAVIKSYQFARKGVVYLFSWARSCWNTTDSILSPRYTRYADIEGTLWQKYMHIWYGAILDEHALGLFLRMRVYKSVYESGHMLDRSHQLCMSVNALPNPFCGSFDLSGLEESYFNLCNLFIGTGLRDKVDPNHKGRLEMRIVPRFMAVHMREGKAKYLAVAMENWPEDMEFGLFFNKGEWALEEYVYLTKHSSWFSSFYLSRLFELEGKPSGEALDSEIRISDLLTGMHIKFEK